MSHVFLSYSAADSKVAEILKASVEQAGITVSAAHAAIVAGDDISDSVQQAIARADYVIVLWSESAARSHWVKYETEFAIQAWSRDSLILARLDSTELPTGLRDLATIDLSTDPDRGIGQIVDRIKIKVDRDPPKMTAARSRIHSPLIIWLSFFATVILLGGGFLWWGMEPVLYPQFPEPHPLPQPHPKPPFPSLPEPPIPDAADVGLVTWLLALLGALVLIALIVFIARRFWHPHRVRRLWHREPEGHLSSMGPDTLTDKGNPDQIFISYTGNEKSNLIKSSFRIVDATATQSIESLASLSIWATLSGLIGRMLERDVMLAPLLRASKLAAL